MDKEDHIKQLEKKVKELKKELEKEKKAHEKIQKEKEKIIHEKEKILHEKEKISQEKKKIEKEFEEFKAKHAITVSNLRKALKIKASVKKQAKPLGAPKGHKGGCLKSKITPRNV